MVAIAIIPNDNPSPIFPGSAINFPQDGAAFGGMSRTGPSTFLLPNIGIYIIEFHASINESAQVIMQLNGVDLPQTVVGRSAISTEIFGIYSIKTTIINSIISLLNPSGNPGPITMTQNAGGLRPVSAHLVIRRVS